MHALYGWAMFTKCSLDAAENKLNYYREGIVLKNCVKS